MFDNVSLNVVANNFKLHRHGHIIVLMILSIMLFTMIHVSNGQSPSTTSIKYSSFNIQVFGQTKMKKTDVVDILMRIVSQYDLIFVMEVRDSTNTTIQDFTSQLNNYVGVNRYEFQLSDRLGRTSSKEQYAFLYNPGKVKFIKTLQYNDTNDWFERPPFTFVFQSAVVSNSPQFAITGCHIKPTDAVSEMSKLVNVSDSYASESFAANNILSGDFNAGCSYVSNSDWSQVALRTDTRFSWLISDQTDTTVSTGACAYDRFVTMQAAAKRNITTQGDNFDFSNIGVFRFDEVYGLNTSYASTVSDHYPIYMNINFKTDSAVATSTVSPKNSTIVLSQANTENYIVSYMGYLLLIMFLTILN